MKNALVVDDEADLRFVICETLKMEGYTVFEASNGEEGLEQFEQINTHIDLVVSDVRMPKQNGLQLLSAIRKTHPKLPVIVMITGFSDTSDADFIATGAQAVFHKPFNINLFIEKILELTKT